MKKLKEKESKLYEVLNLISNIFPNHLYEYIYCDHPIWYDKMSLLEDQIINNMRLNLDQDNFVALLEEYWYLHLKIYNIYLEIKFKNAS